MRYIKLLVICCLLFVAFEGFTQSKIRIACIGNSITYGSGLADRAKESYPAQLQALLGNGYEVLNFGVSGATMLKKGNKPYWNTPEYQKVLSSEANLVFIKLGTNDSKQINRPMMADFVNDYRNMIRTLGKLSTKPRIVLLLPVKAFSDDKFGISGTYLKDSIMPSIQKLAYDEKLELIDLYSLFADKEALLADKIHPNAVGDGFIATRLRDFIAQKTKPVSSETDIKGLDLKTERTSFYGYSCFQFNFNGRVARIVVPKREAIGKLWIWRARFWGHEPQTDIAMLERGYHVVYCDVAELFGNAEAIEL